MIINRTIFRYTIKQWLKSHFRLLAVTLIFLAMLAERSFKLYIAERPPLEASYSAGDQMAFFVLILGIGIVGLQRSSGNLCLTFARPIERSSYILTKWLVLACAASSIAMIELACEHAIFSVYMPGLFLNIDILINLLERLATCLAASATIVFFSSMVPHTGDFMVWGCCAFVTMQINSSCADILKSTDPDGGGGIFVSLLYYLSLCGEFFCSLILSFLAPSLNVRADFLAGETCLLGITVLISNITIALLLAIWFTNRSEVNYGSS